MNHHFSSFFTSNEFTLPSIDSKVYFEVISILSIKFDPCLGWRVLINVAYAIVPCWITEIPEHLKTQDMCDEAADIEPCSLGFVPDHLKTQEVCNEAVRREPYTLQYVPDHFRTQKMCTESVEEDPRLLECVPDRLKTQALIILLGGEMHVKNERIKKPQ